MQDLKRELENIDAFLSNTAGIPDEEISTADTVPSQERLSEQIKQRRGWVANRINDCWKLEDYYRDRWLAALGGVDLFHPRAAADLENLRLRVTEYQKIFPYQFSLRNNYSSAHRLLLALGRLAETLTELSTLCQEYQDRYGENC